MDADLLHLEEELCSTNAQRRVDAAEQLSLLGHQASPAVIPLLCTLRDSDEQVREYVTSALENLGPPPTNQLGHLVPMLQDENLDIGYWAATLLGRLGRIGGPAAESLADVLQHSTHTVVRERSAWALGEIGKEASVALDQLHRTAQGSEPRLARLAQEAIEKITGEADE
ncbi:HEAT repeat domain-containing protein [Lignipirellula cremea]|uniref:HEAT repeat protein n=1 Tax=Lignipirellula cremea TaxID=2528010 RepID=A0A518DVA4_9BACT|nr:HEAT repeat domain-containing protein [Lignipirellula cremea]QDU95763.1 HEAT repeat protein [Lignipirellula cremea]